MSDDFATLILGAKTDGLKGGEVALARLVKSGENAERKIGMSMASITKSAALAGAGFLSAFASVQTISKATTLSLGFNAAMAETSTLIDSNAAQMAQLEQSARSLAVTYGTQSTPQVEAFYQALSSGAATVADAATLVDTANRLAVGGVTDVTTAVDILSTATNVYVDEGLKAADASDALFVGMKAGKTTITELSSSLGKVLPLAQKLGVSFDETVAATSALTKGGIATAEAVTGLRASMTAILGPSKEASDLADSLGLQFDAAALKAKGFAGFMADVVDKTDGSTEAMATLFGSVEATTVALSMSGAAGGFMADILGQMTDKAGQTTAAFDKINNSLSGRLNRAMAAAGDILLSLGNVVLPVLVPLLEATATVLQAVAAHSDTLAFAISAMAAAYTVSLIPAAWAAITAFGANMVALGALAIEFGVMEAAALTAGSAMLLLTPVGWVVGIGLAAGAIYGMAKAFGQAGSAAEIQAASARELDDALKGVNRTTDEGIAKANGIGEAMLNAARAEVLAARIKMANANAMASMAAPGRDTQAGQIRARQAEAELAGVEAKLTGIMQEADALGLVLSKTPQEIANAAAQAQVLSAEMHRVGVEAGLSATAISGINTLGVDQLATLQAKNELLRLEYAYGQDSYALAEARHQQDIAALETEMTKNGIFGEQRLAILAAADESFRLEWMLANSTTAASRLYGSLAMLSGAISPAVSAAWQLVSALGAAIGRLSGVASGLMRIAQLSSATNAISSTVTNGLAAASSALAPLTSRLGEMHTEITGVLSSGGKLADKLKSLSGPGLSDAFADSAKNGKSLSEVLAGGGVGRGGSVASGAKAATKALTATEEAAKKYADTMSGFVTDGISRAVDWMTNGFKGGMKGILRIFTDTIKQMIAFAIKNRIMVSLGIGGGGSLGGLAGAATSAAAPKAGAGGGGFLSAIGSFGSSLLSGASGVFTSLFGAGGGLGSLGTYMSSVLGTATTSVGAFGAAVGAIAVPLLAVAAVFSFFKKKVTLLDSGMRITVNGLTSVVETFKKNKITQFWGLSKKIKTTYTPAEAAVAGPMEKIVKSLQSGIMDMAATIGVGSSAFAKFAKDITISTKGMTDEQARAEIEKQIGAFGDAFAAMVPGLIALAKDGEGAATTLQRLAGSLLLSNQWLARFETNLFATSVAGAGLASNFTDIFGSLDALNSASAAYYQNFYSDSERVARASVELHAALKSLGIDALPQSRDAFRGLVDAAFAAGNTDLAAKLIKLAPAMAEITDQTDALTTSLKALENQNLYRSRSEMDFAQTANGHRASIASISTAETNALLAEVVKAIREGDINSARLQVKILDLQSRAQFGTS